MIADPTRPLSADQARRNRRVIVAIAVVFVITSVAVFVWGLTVTQAARGKARDTDAALRTVAWAVLCYASANDGAFPVRDEQVALLDAATGPPTGGQWPSTRESALGGLAPMATRDAVSAIGITWGSGPDVAPNLNTNGKSSTRGTVDTVNGWIAEYARARARGEAAPVPATK
ncbi:MAG: hypothetical protein FGM39_09325 [Phycisphaerales bacterium]|nr:hypothetical protein [Phycisphaerales bacterium]